MFLQCPGDSENTDFTKYRRLRSIAWNVTVFTLFYKMTSPYLAGMTRVPFLPAWSRKTYFLEEAHGVSFVSFLKLTSAKS